MTSPHSVVALFRTGTTSRQALSLCNGLSDMTPCTRCPGNRTSGFTSWCCIRVNVLSTLQHARPGPLTPGLSTTWNSCGQCFVVTPCEMACERASKTCSSAHQAAGVMQMYATARRSSSLSRRSASLRNAGVLQWIVRLSQSTKSPARSVSKLGPPPSLSVMMASLSSSRTKSASVLCFLRMSLWKRCERGTTMRPPVRASASVSVKKPCTQCNPGFVFPWSTWYHACPVLQFAFLP
mmetsp:Transcript_60250/g.166760  ORF Transcript_60250/g.166760 Transcript_60250/m.166760 type:complete len:237 (-) Transcript_60250:576-1286(-)